MVAKGKYFHIVSRVSGRVLDISGGKVADGGEVVVYVRHDGDNQVWYHDPMTGTIRSKLNPVFCLDINESNRLVVRHYNAGNSNQQWQYNEDREVIENRNDSNRVLDVVVDSAESNSDKVCAYGFHGGNNQRWKLECQPPRYFFIQSKLNGFVLDLDGGSSQPGTKVIMYPQRSSNNDNQLWFEDWFGNIRSKINPDLVLDGNDGTVRVSSMEFGARRRGLFWVIDDHRIVDAYNPDTVMDIRGASTSECAELAPCKYHGGSHQQWNIVHI